MRYWPLALGVFGVAVVVTQLWPLWTDVYRLALGVELLALLTGIGLAMGEKRG